MLPSHDRRDKAAPPDVEVPLVTNPRTAAAAAAGRSSSPGATAGNNGGTGEKGAHYISDFTIDVSGSKRRTSDEPPPSRWRTPEFIVYGVLFLIVVPVLVHWPMKLSEVGNQFYWQYAARLSPGWLFGREVDASDPQYRTFRGNFWPLIGLAAVFLVPSHAARRLGYTSASARARFYAGAGIILITILHGVGAIKVFALLYITYAAARARKPPAIERIWSPVVVIGTMFILFLVYISDGFALSRLHPALDESAWSGLHPRWYIGFNITVLRIISFMLDQHWRAASPSSASAPVDHRSRVATSLPDADYSFVNYIAYTLYPPLYIAGPIMTFQDFVWQLHHPVAISARERISYAFRFAFCMLTMESILHTMYVVAIKDARAWAGMGAADMALVGFWNLVIVWLKLLIPWRYFRLWALLDGIDPPENMVRCVANNYSTLGFWRSWHRSYNLWVVRYIYIPLGGAKRMALATLMVFTFVALWHDLSFRLLMWGWLISLFILPEIIGRALVPAGKYGSRVWYRHVAACGGVVNVLMMMGANLIGFVLDGAAMRQLLHELFSTSSGWKFFLFSCSCLFVAVQVMFEYRNEEARRGIDRRC